MQQLLLAQLTGKYLWWTPGGAPHESRRVIAQVMELGTHEDAEALRAALGDDALKDTLRAAHPGWFSGKSWHYWHYALGLARLGGVPPLPRRSFQSDSLLRNLPLLRQAAVAQEAPNTLTVFVPAAGPEGVKLSFFGGLGFGRLDQPTLTPDGVMEIASAVDLLAHKLKVILQRVESKDYLDIDALLRDGQSLAGGLAGAQALYPNFPPQEAIKALTWFEGGDLQALAHSVRERLVEAASGIRSIPKAGIVSARLAA